MPATSLELFFIDGKPDGMLTAEVFGWTGHILVAPRTRLAGALKRNESRAIQVSISFWMITRIRLLTLAKGKIYLTA